MKVNPRHPAIIEGRTIFTNSVIKSDKLMLKPGSNNRKLGFIITKGKYKGYPIFSLSLEERKTCPRDCIFWVNCYTNNMYLAQRYNHKDKSFYKILEENIKELNNKYKGFIVRTHVSGDFFSVEYIKFWERMLNKYSGLNIFGYTAYKNGPRYREIQRLNNDYPNKFNVRTSGVNASFSTNSTNNMEPFVLYKNGKKKQVKGVVCPEQTGKTKSCATCGLLCANRNVEQVLFIPH